jgi:hypothetical protein
MRGGSAEQRNGSEEQRADDVDSAVAGVDIARIAEGDSPVHSQVEVAEYDEFSAKACAHECFFDFEGQGVGLRDAADVEEAAEDEVPVGHSVAVLSRGAEGAAPDFGGLARREEARDVEAVFCACDEGVIAGEEGFGVAADGEEAADGFLFVWDEAIAEGVLAAEGECELVGEGGACGWGLRIEPAVAEEERFEVEGVSESPAEDGPVSVDIEAAEALDFEVFGTGDAAEVGLDAEFGIAAGAEGFALVACAEVGDEEFGFADDVGWDVADADALPACAAEDVDEGAADLEGVEDEFAADVP